MNQKQKENLKQMIKDYESDTTIECKIFLFKAMMVVVFFTITFYLLIGTLNPVVIYEVLGKEFNIYFHIFTKFLGNLGDQDL